MFALSNACSVLPIKEFNVSKRSDYKDFKKLKNKYASIFPNERNEGESEGPSYENYFALPLNFKNCQVEIYHEVTHYRTGGTDGFLYGLSIASLSIIPYSSELSFKTRIALTSNVETVSKEITSEKMDIRFGLIYIPLFIGAMFNHETHITNNITAKMYAAQISKLAEELKDFKCD